MAAIPANNITISNLNLGQIAYASGGLVSNHSQSGIAIDFHGSSAVHIGMSPKDLAELKDDSRLLYALLDAGVEEWEGFAEAIEIYREGGE